MNVWFFEEKSSEDPRVALRAYTGQYLGYNRHEGVVEMSGTPLWFSPIVTNTIDGRMKLTDIERILSEEEELHMELYIPPPEETNQHNGSTIPNNNNGGGGGASVIGAPPTGWLVSKLSGTIMLTPDKYPPPSSSPTQGGMLLPPSSPMPKASGNISLLPMSASSQAAPSYSPKWVVRRYNSKWPSILAQLYAKLEVLHPAIVLEVKELVMVSYS
jgi:hypothetical protein